MLGYNQNTNNVPKRGRGRPPKNVDVKPVDTQPEETRKRFAVPQLKLLPTKINLKLALWTALVLLIVTPSLYFYDKSKDTQRRLSEIESKSQNDLNDPAKLIEKVGKHVVLPESEEPTIATVTDTSKLINQPFFAQAAQGDKVLVYNQTKRAFLYRPSADKIIEATSLNADTNQTPTP